MPRKNVPDAKNRILQAALQIFAEKTFEGARVDDIAQTANVPKSLIYYHFKNKEEILDVLVNNFVAEYTQLLHIAEKDTHAEKAQAFQERIQNHYREFAVKNTDLIRIILIESLKKSNTRPVVYKIVEALIEAEEKFTRLPQLGSYDRNERLVVEFFTSILPNCAYLCFADSWVEYFQMDKKLFDDIYLKAITETHGAYHKNHP
jgi:AcrR family transcriptional regulator